jgi:hypothetical protein
MEKTRSEMTIQHVIQTYVRPARKRGEQTVKLHVGTVQKELGWTNRTPSIFSTLGSGKFQREAGLELLEKQDGPASGGPSTTVQFVYRLLEPATKMNTSNTPQKIVPNGKGLLKLRGILTDVYKQFGGGEQYLRKEREGLHFTAEEPASASTRAKK